MWHEVVSVNSWLCVPFLPLSFLSIYSSHLLNTPLYSVFCPMHIKSSVCPSPYAIHHSLPSLVLLFFSLHWDYHYSFLLSSPPFIIHLHFQCCHSCFSPHFPTFSTVSCRFSFNPGDFLLHALSLKSPYFTFYLLTILPFLQALLVLNLFPFQMPSVFLFLHQISSFTFFTVSFIFSSPLFSFHPSLCDFFPLLPSLYTILHPSLSPSSTLHSQGILWLISLFSFSSSRSLSL